MNRFHLLALEDEESTTSTSPVAPVLPEPIDTKKVYNTQREGKNSTPGKMERRPKGPRKGEGEKHQTVGKGSWGRPTDGALPEDECVEETDSKPLTEEAKTPSPPKPAFKTVSEYLAEQAEQQRRLASRNKIPVRNVTANSELDTELEIVHKSEMKSTLAADTIVSSKKSTGTPTITKETSMKRMTLQELNKILPRVEQQRPRQDAERPPRRDSNNDRPPRKDGGNHHPRQDNDRRFSITKPPTANLTKINLADKTAFPSFA